MQNVFSCSSLHSRQRSGQHSHELSHAKRVVFNSPEHSRQRSGQHSHELSHAKHVVSNSPELGATPYRNCGQALETLQDPPKTAAKSQDNSHKNQENAHKSSNDQQQFLQGLADPSGFSTMVRKRKQTRFRNEDHRLVQNTPRFLRPHGLCGGEAPNRNR